MKNKILFGIIGFVLGVAAGGYFVGSTCASHYRDDIERLEEQNEFLTDELEKTRNKAVSEPFKSTAEAPKDKRSEDDDHKFDFLRKRAIEKYKIKPEDYDRPVKVFYGDDEEKTIEFKNFGDLIAFADPALALKADEDLRKVAFPDFEKISGLDLKNNRVNYETLSRKYGSDSFDRSMESMSHPDEDSNDPEDIHIISEAEFSENLPFRDNETFTYYQEDGVLVDSAEMPVHNEEETIGLEALDKLAETDDDYLYVSNEMEDKMYEIVIERNISYYRDMIGSTIE